MTCLTKNAFLVIFLELTYMIKILLTELSLAQNKKMNEIGSQYRPYFSNPPKEDLLANISNLEHQLLLQFYF